MSGCTLRGFEVDPCWGAFYMAGELLLAILRLRSTMKNIHMLNTHIQTHTVYVYADTQLEAVLEETVFHETGEWATKHHTCQLLSSRQNSVNQTLQDLPSLVG